MAVTNPDAPPHQRASMIIVPTDTPGFDLVRNVSVMGDVRVRARQPRRGHLPVVPGAASNLLGRRGQRLRRSPRSGSGPAASTTACAGSASPTDAFDMMCARANERVITPDGETLADRQVIQHWVAELDAEIRGARLQTLHAAWMIDRHGAKAARDEISAIKFSVANTMLQAVDTAIQVHGALGVTDDTVLSLLVPPRAGRPHLRRRRRGPQDHASAAASCAGTPEPPSRAQPTRPPSG